MLPGKLDIEIYRGDTNRSRLINFTGFFGSNVVSVQMDIRPLGIPTTLVRSLTSTAGDITITDPAAVITINPYQWDGAAGAYEYDLQLTLADASVQTLLAGRYNVIQDITQ